MGNGRLKQRQRVTKAPVMGAQKNTIKQTPLSVNIRLSFTDCEDQVRPFPKDMQVEVVLGDDARKETRKIIDDKGTLFFPLSRADAEKFKFLRLKFAPGDKNYVICEKAGAAEKTSEIGTKDNAEQKAKDGARFFRLPSQWSLLTSDWAVTADEQVYDKADKGKRFLLLDGVKPRDIGTREAPVPAVLNPHWQYVRFEYFDRYYGHTDHDNKPIGILPIILDGIFKSKTGDERPDTRSNWTILQGGDQKKTTQCLPWILQAKPDGTAEPKPDKESMLKFVQPKDTFIKAKSATERELAKVARPLLLDAERLKYYDLPVQWKAKNYWCRLSESKEEQGFFERIVALKTAKDKPLIFSLDDIVLTDHKVSPLTVYETDKITLFYHEFLDPKSDALKRGTGGRAGATYLKNGLYKPGPKINDVKKQAELEKAAREPAEAERRRREEANARQLAEFSAEQSGASGSEIKRAGLTAATNVANDEAAQKRIKEAGDKAAAHATRNAVKSKTIEYPAEDVDLLAKDTTDVVNSARSKQRAIEEKPLREEAAQKQRTIEERNARKVAQDQARKNRLPERDVTASGDRAVAGIANDKAAQERINMAAANAAAGVNADPTAKARINKAGTNAENAFLAYPYSDILRHKETPNYISDYPHWTRVLVSNGNLFDIFDERTVSGDVIGARAAVRLVDATATGVGVEAGRVLSPRPGFTPPKAEQDEASFIIQPYFDQKFFVRSKSGQASANRPQGIYNEWDSPIAEGEALVAKNSRTDMVLLRSCNFKGTNEESVVFRYHRLSFDFTAHETLLNPAVPPADIEDQRRNWLTTFLLTVAERWNGNDPPYNSSRAWIVEDKPADPRMRAQVVSFFQEVTKKNAQYHIETVGEIKPDGSAQHSSMDPKLGHGNFRIKAGYSNKGDFSGAHEMGHAGGQPDDYAPSVKGQTGFGSNHTPGAPFNLDRTAMMKKNKQVRARSFWHITEWLRQLKPFKDVKFQVDHAGFKYKIPHYNHLDRPGRNYTHWPVRANVFHAPADPIYFDSFLFFLGPDEYSQNVLSLKPDGMLVVVVKMLFDFDGYTDNEEIIKHVFSRVNQKINTALNKKRVFAKFSLPGIDRGGTETFERCMLHFSPRFETTTGLPAHFTIGISTPPDPPDPPTLPSAGPGGSYYVNDGTRDVGPFTTAEMYDFIKNGQLHPGMPVDDGGGPKNANDYPELKTVFDNFYWYDDGGSGPPMPQTLRQLYDLAKAGTIKWDTDIVGPGADPSSVQHADKITELHPVLERWCYTDSGRDYGDYTEIDMHKVFNDNIDYEKANICGEQTDNVWGPAKDWPEFEQNFKGDTAPRTLDFAFPPDPGSLPALNEVVKRLENVIFKNFCKLVGLSDDSADSKHYEKAGAYKDIVQACVNDNSLNPVMSRMR